MSIRSVKVSNISLGATEQDIKEFFTFSGEIEYIEMQSESESSRIAYVTFKNSEGAETSVLLSGSVVSGQPITVASAPDYELPASARSSVPAATEIKTPESGLRNAEEIVTSMLAKGFILGKDALNRAKSFDEKHQLSSKATTTVVSLDQKFGLTEKISAGTTMVNDKVREMDQRYQVSGKTKYAISAAEQSVSSAGSAIMKNRYVLTGATWVTGAFSRVAKKAGEVGQKTKDKVLAEEDQASVQVQGGHSIAQNNKEAEPQKATTADQDQPSKPAPAQGLIL